MANVVATEKIATEELSGEMGRQILRLLAVTALGGGAARFGMSMLRNANPRYEAPEIPKPIVVDMPYHTTEAPATSKGIPLPGKEKPQRGGLKTAAQEWLKDLPGGQTIYDALPTSRPLTGAPGETSPSKVPLFSAALPAVAAAGLGGGYYLTDKLLRAADRWNARRELNDAKREYQEAVMGRLRRTSLSSKEAAENGPQTSEMTHVKAAIDGLYDAVCTHHATSSTKAAVESDALEVLKNILWPGSYLGDDAARINMGLAGAAGLGGGVLGYRAYRNDKDKETTRKLMRDVDRNNAEGIPAPIVGRLIPVPSAGR